MKGAALRVEAALALALAWTLVFLVPLRHMRRLFGTITGPMGNGAPPPGPVLARAQAVARRVDRVAGRLPWQSTCLVRAVAARLLLARRRIDGGIIRFGIRKNDGALEAHAWLILGGTILMGGEEVETYAPLADLAATGRRTVR